MKNTFPVGLALVLAAFACNAQRYEVRELGVTRGSDRSAIFDVNDNGVVAGTSWYSYLAWEPVAFPLYGPPKNPPNSLGIPTYTYAARINNKNEVLAYNHFQSIIWKGSQATYIPHGGWDSLSPKAMNDKGQVVGIGETRCCENYKIGAWIYKDGQLADLTSLFGQYFEPVAINNNGDIAGLRFVLNDAGDYLMDGVRIVNGRLQSLKKFITARDVQPMAMNNYGDVAGMVRDSVEVGGDAFALIGKAACRIKTPRGYGGWAADINDAGRVVGVSFDASGAQWAFTWHRGVVTDLSSLPEVKAAGWQQLVDAVAVNNDGVIVGNGINAAGQSRGYMLTPTRR